MNPILRFLTMSVLTVLLISTVSDLAFACGSCYGAADSSATSGMNFAILSMLGVTGSVLAGMASFFLFLRKRAKVYLTSNGSPATVDETEALDK